jgi:hypothetical protein
VPPATLDPVDEIKSPLAVHVNSFVKNIGSLRHTLSLSMGALRSTAEIAEGDFGAFVKEHCTVSRQDNQEFTLVPGDHHARFRLLLKRVEHARLADQLVPRSYLVSVLSEYDAFLGGLLRLLISAQQALLFSGEKTLTYEQLVKFGSIEAATDWLIEKEAESLLRQSHVEQFDTLEKQFSVPLRKELSVWPVFVELTQRRNLYVHNRGVVTDQYLTVCRKHGVSLDGIQRGVELGITPVYFRQAYECIFEIGVKLAHVLWRKQLPDDVEAADKNLISVIYDLICAKHYRLARVLADFSTETLKKHASDETKRIKIINRAQTYRWLDQKAESVKQIKDVDWTASSYQFRLGAAVLLDTYDEGARLMRLIGAKGEVSKSDYRDWPLFRDFRDTAAFKEAFQEIFGEPVVPPIAPERAVAALPERSPETLPAPEDAGTASSEPPGEPNPETLH